EDFEDALIGYQAFKGMSSARNTPEYKNIDYNIGYAYFNQQKYDGAVRHFKSFLESGAAQGRDKYDAFVRLGDSYFANSDYWKAMEEYNKAIAQNANSDYARFQKAISYGFVDRNEKKIEDLNAFIRDFPKSIYYDDAIYELGNTYISEGQ